MVASYVERLELSIQAGYAVAETSWLIPAIDMIISVDYLPISNEERGKKTSLL